MERIYNILVKILGESKQGGYDKNCSQYQFNSPWSADDNNGIPDNKYNLEISFQLGKYHDWTTDYGGNISKLISLRGGRALLEEYKSIINEIKESRYYDLSLFKDNADMFKEKEYLKLPQTFEKINLDTCNDKQLVEYLKKRKITQDIIDRFNIGRTTWEESDWTWRNRIIFPSYDINGDLNYYIGRTYRTNDQRGKYKNCKADKNAIILHENLIQPDGLVILVEGAIDCIYGPNIISMMGKFINKKCKIYDYLVQKVRGPIYICLDGDTEDYETKKIYKLLNSTLALNGRIWYIRMGEGSLSEYKDFGDLYEAEGKEGIIKAIRSAKQYNEIDIAFLSKKRYINKKENGNKG
jgi:DNA primase